MTLWNWIILFLVGLIGVAVGMFINAFRIKSSIIGTLVLTKHESKEDPYLFVELDAPLSSIKWKKFAIMRVSQK